MTTLGGQKVYESTAIRQVAGDVIRPGGLDLTDKAAKYCAFSKESPILDIGCGIGTTVAYLKEKYGFDAMGIDPSELLLSEGRLKHPNITLLKGRGEKLPFSDEMMEGVFNECTLSLMEDLEGAVAEVYRVLKSKGLWVISDVYAQEAKWVTALQKTKLQSCIRGMFDLPMLKETLKKFGFKEVFFEDHTASLKQMMVNMVLTYGTMEMFWKKATACCGTDLSMVHETVKKCKPGYFLMILQKN
ncbi:DVU_1556 family methyltransferase [Clostridium formicaceticum]|uniref:Sarcosine/dimethylglycine N-methyltransferase n=1 Tax=Clostridium formicaceticum TaxID=1497 RepID=A0AAC9RK92_9CLOT|nr:class I SAM-dependent methyltransferase [Clostridium formicaceticum]AOY76455.1 hypothetical protein BJL90_11375 [Clostridium formicaceticum]ARE86853.1 Sarcosine/dimethylglycine N-methyltransferase [Clostridium formicaceticum]